MRESSGRDLWSAEDKRKAGVFNLLMDGGHGSCIRAQRWAGSQGNLRKTPEKTTGHSSQLLSTGTGDPHSHRQKGDCQNCDTITSSSRHIFWLPLFVFLLNNWPPFCRKRNKQTNPYRQYILERSAVSLLSPSLFQHHIMKSPQYILKNPTWTTKHKIPATKKRQKINPTKQKNTKQIDKKPKQTKNKK